MSSFFVMTYPSFEVGKCKSAAVCKADSNCFSCMEKYRHLGWHADVAMQYWWCAKMSAFKDSSCQTNALLLWVTWQTVIKFRYYVLVPKVSEYLLYQMYYSERAIWRIWTVWFEKQVRAWSGQPQGQKAIYVNTASKKRFNICKAHLVINEFTE